MTHRGRRSVSGNDRFILVSDVHLGGGAAADAAGPGFADPFTDDDAFVGFLSYLRCREDRRPYRLVLLGDTLDFLRVPVTRSRTGLYARNDAEAIGQLDQIHAAHRAVFGGLADLLSSGAGVDVVVGNHDIELARPAVRRHLRTLLASDHDCAPPALESLRFYPWAYHVPGILYAEHGNHYHDINTFDRQLHPFRRNGLLERPRGARLGGVRRLTPGRSAGRWAYDALADMLPRRRPDRATRSAYGLILDEYALELGLAADAVARLHDMGRTSVPRIARRLVRSRLAGGTTFPAQLPQIAVAVHEVLGSSGQPASFYAFGHAHIAQNAPMPGTGARYLNAGTWSTEGAESAARPQGVRCTWIEIDRDGDGPPTATLLRWAGRPAEVPGLVDGAPAESGEVRLAGG